MIKTFLGLSFIALFLFGVFEFDNNPPITIIFVMLVCFWLGYWVKSHNQY